MNENNNKYLYDYTLSIMEDFEGIVNPLEDIGIKYFSYYKVLNGKAIYISSHKVWHEMHYMSEGGFEGISRSLEFCQATDTKKTVFCGDPTKPRNQNMKLYAPGRPMNGEKMAEFNLWNACSLYKNSDNSFESYNFFAGNNNSRIREFYEKEDKYLYRFISYFLTNMQYMLENLEDKHWVGIYDSENCLSYKLKKQENKKLFTVTADGNFIKLTEKQYDLLYYLAKGGLIKSAEEVLGVTESTANNYINRLKAKLGYSNTTQLIRLWYESLQS